MYSETRLLLFLALKKQSTFEMQTASDINQFRKFRRSVNKTVGKSIFSAVELLEKCSNIFSNDKLRTSIKDISNLVSQSACQFGVHKSIEISYYIFIHMCEVFLFFICILRPASIKIFGCHSLKCQICNTLKSIQDLNPSTNSF